MTNIHEVNRIHFRPLLCGLAAALSLVFILAPRNPLAAQETAVQQPGSSIYDAGQWIEMGSGSASGGGLSQTPDWSFSPALAFDGEGMPIIAWCKQNGLEEGIHVKRWNGEAWEAWGSPSTPDGGIVKDSAFCPFLSLAMGHDGYPIVTWYGETYEIYVRRWDGTAWVEMGPGSASGGGISNSGGEAFHPALAVGPDGVPIVAWEDYWSGQDEIYVKRWDGAAWVEIGSGSAFRGGISNSAGGANQPALAVGPDGMPVVAWYAWSFGAHPEIYVRRWDGQSWVEIGSGSASGGGISKTANALDPSLAISPGGEPMIAWEDYSTGAAEIYVRRWNGQDWVEVGPGSASGGGISDNQGNSLEPSLAFDLEGNPIVAWYDNSRIVTEIYIRRWNGASWVELGDASATGGGISHNPGSSEYPFTAVDPNGTLIVTWEDYSDDGYPCDIYVRRWQPKGNYVLRVEGQQEGIEADLNAPLTAGTLPENTLSLPVIFSGLPLFTGHREHEPNNDFSSANGPLVFNATYLGSFTGEEDTGDYFYFKLPAAQNVTVTLSEIPVGENNNLFLLDATREIVASSSNPRDLDEKIQLNLPKGPYYVLVRPAGS